MKTFKIIWKIALWGCLCLFFVNCQEDNGLREMDKIQNPYSEYSDSHRMIGLSSSSTANYLMDLINTIESMVEDGLLNKGNANALIVKIKNAIKR